MHFYSCLLLPFTGLCALACATQQNSTSSTGCTYTSVDHISKVFSYFEAGDYPNFFEYVIDDVDWDVQGTHPLAGRYNNKTVFAANTIVRLGRLQNPSLPHTTTVVNVIGGCDEAWSVEELRVIATFQNGR